MVKNFKFEDGKLIVDAAYHDPHYPGDYVLIIDGDAYLLPAGRNYQAESVLEAMRPLKFYSMKNSHEKIMEYEYVFLSCVPKDGFNVQLGRPLTRVEFSLLCNEYHITEEDITDEFEDVKGKLYGKYAKAYTCVQIRMENKKALELEQKLNQMGIEAGNICPGRINIRVK